jgi:alpha-amylase/alpha-mannosidase (GH57 family)
MTDMKNTALMIHGHFYQPPRQNVLTSIIPQESGVFPYHNWNEKINAECYKPNADQENFRKISFNVGPTLFAWLENYDLGTYWRIIQQDNDNQRTHGVGNSVAQSFNHSILPLANKEDKRTQILWGIADYQSRFGHAPAGMWLPETAVDYDTLEMIRDCGIQFTILAPWQANSTSLDTTEAYNVKLGGGKTIAAFFYNQDLSTRLSFDPWSSSNADIFTKDILPSHYNPEKLRKNIPQFVMVASDGELYGHHQPFRDKFLTRLVDGAASTQNIDMSYPAFWLLQNQPRQSITIREDSSWSCQHALSRWRGECPCTPGSSWKAPLRSALDTVGTLLNQVYAEETAKMTPDPWELRNRSIWMWLGKRTLYEIMDGLVREGMTRQEIERLLLLLEAQKARQWMFTSCGWFFDEFDRIEPRNNVAYAAQAVWLTEKATGVNLSVEAGNCFRDVVSARTGLSAFDVFMNNYEQARNTLLKLPEY